MIEVNSNIKLEYDSFCFVTGSENLLIYDGGGKVLAYQNDSLNILDVSHYWRSSYNSFNFFRKKNIYSYGGYGYFSTRNNLISFDFNSKEWHNTNAKPSINLNRKDVIGHYSMKKDQLFIGLGWDDYDNKYSDAHVFDFKSNKWTKYAEIENVNGVTIAEPDEELNKAVGETRGDDTTPDSNKSEGLANCTSTVLVDEQNQNPHCQDT